MHLEESVWWPMSLPKSTADELRRFLKDKLPDHMVPAIFVLLDALPLMPNGKIDRRALPAPDRSRRELDKPFEAPRAPTEELLAQIWPQLLDIEQVGIHDDFFDLGGHSLLATQLMSRVREAFQVEIPLRRLFEVPTVAGLAESIEAARRAGQNLSAPPILPVPRDGDLRSLICPAAAMVLRSVGTGSLGLQHSGRRPSQGSTQPGGAGAESQ